MLRRWRLPLLHLLLLLRVFLNQLIGLLLLLLYLLRSSGGGFLLSQALVIFVLLGRQFLAFLILLFVHLVLLGLIFLVRRRIAGVRGSPRWRGNILHVTRLCSGCGSFCACSPVVFRALRGLVWRSCFFRCYNSIALELIRSLRCCDR